ncbi:9358_t:CDS:2, partial [Racocetra persica]
MTTYQSIEEGIPRNHPSGSGSDDDKIGLLSNVKRRRQFLNFLKIAIGVICFGTILWCSFIWFQVSDGISFHQLCLNPVMREKYTFFGDNNSIGTLAAQN